MDSIPNEVFAKLPIFANLNDTERQQLVDIASTLTFKPGQTALAQGESGQDLLVVLEGKCQVIKTTDSKPPCVITLAELEPYETFGEMSFFLEAPHSATVLAETKLKVLRIQRSDYDLLIQENNLAAYKLAFNVVQKLTERLRKMDHWVSDLMCSGTEETTASEWSTFRDKLFTELNL